MAIHLNHTIVPAHDKEKSAKFIAYIMGLEYDVHAAAMTGQRLLNLLEGVALGKCGGENPCLLKRLG